MKAVKMKIDTSLCTIVISWNCLSIELVFFLYQLISENNNSIWLNIFHLFAQKPNLEENKSIYLNKFYHNFHLPESHFTCPRQVGNDCNIYNQTINIFSWLSFFKCYHWKLQCKIVFFPIFHVNHLFSMKILF